MAYGHGLDSELSDCQAFALPDQRQLVPCRRGRSMMVQAGSLTKKRDFARGAHGSSRSVLSYYLVWSPGIFLRTVVCFVTMLVLQLSLGRALSISDGIRTPASPLAQSIWRDFLLPLLSSACCGVQLLINALVGAGGCAGFNKWLGPLRPYFLGAMLSTAAASLLQGHLGC